MVHLEQVHSHHNGFADSVINLHTVDSLGQKTAGGALPDPLRPAKSMNPRT